MNKIVTFTAIGFVFAALRIDYGVSLSRNSNLFSSSAVGFVKYGNITPGANLLIAGDFFLSLALVVWIVVFGAEQGSFGALGSGNGASFKMNSAQAPPPEMAHFQAPPVDASMTPSMPPSADTSVANATVPVAAAASAVPVVTKARALYNCEWGVFLYVNGICINPRSFSFSFNL